MLTNALSSLVPPLARGARGVIRERDNLETNCSQEKRIHRAIAIAVTPCITPRAPDTLGGKTVKWEVAVRSITLI